MNLFAQAYSNRIHDPSHILLSDADHDYTLTDVDVISSQVYGSLKARGIGRENVVMILLPRCALTGCVFFGILKAGACAVIVDAGASEDYRRFFLEDAGPAAVIAEDADLVTTCLPDGEKCPYILTVREIMESEAVEGWVEPDLHDAAAVVYTSSSSGRPKGAVHEYGDIDLLLTYSFGYSGGTYDYAHERCALAAQLYDVATITAMIEALYAASYIHVISREICRDVDLYAREIRERELTTAMLMPHMTDLKLLSEIPSLEYLFVAFDIIEHVYIPGFPIINCYGMSESFLSVASFPIDRDYEITPVGRPNAFRGTCLIGEDGQPVAEGEIGEVAFPNPYFRGYLHLPELTESAMEGGLYHTGDMGIINAQGNLVILGRKEDLLSTEEGYIIPSLVKSAVGRSYPGTLAVRALAGEDGCHIVVFYVEDGGRAFDVCCVRAELAGRLPDYMMPTDYIRLERMPLLNSGKLNRIRLREIFEEQGVNLCG